ncbi:Hypothetical protein R9X50_00641800 [Acrodontium crateriforme]|uniref:Uncharacterized protein n=1 Tax=Acrodontium crateriforme TaxID=150365 RepID=A0AAQ3RDL8_9PEZI|nr:Hypothetical protein R9X50_00641800 [Acrodontium crateriforme]
MARITKREGKEKKDGAQMEPVQPAEEEFEEEFHTEESDNDSNENDLERDVANENEVASGEEDRESDENEHDESLSKSKSSAPLLPAHLLKSTPKPATEYSTSSESATRERRALRPRSKQAKKQLLDQLRFDTKGTGVIEAGKAAQKKRNISPRSNKDRVRAGRIGKKSKAPPRSGRQQLMDQRKAQLNKR